MIATITRDEIKASLDRGDGLVLVETLPADVYESRHLPGAINLPFEQPEEIADLAARLLPDKDALIVVYCMSRI